VEKHLKQTDRVSTPDSEGFRKRESLWVIGAATLHNEILSPLRNNFPDCREMTQESSRLSLRLAAFSK
jgi:hypothetical protein